MQKLISALYLVKVELICLKWTQSCSFSTQTRNLTCLKIEELGELLVVLDNEDVGVAVLHDEFTGVGAARRVDARSHPAGKHGGKVRHKPLGGVEAYGIRG